MFVSAIKVVSVLALGLFSIRVGLIFALTGLFSFRDGFLEMCFVSLVFTLFVLATKASFMIPLSLLLNLRLADSSGRRRPGSQSLRLSVVHQALGAFLTGSEHDLGEGAVRLAFVQP